MEDYNIDFFISFFSRFIYKEEWENTTDKNIVLMDFKEYFNNLSLTDKIRICCYDKYMSSSDLFAIDNSKSEQVIRNTLTRLNKQRNLKVKKKSGVGYYKSTKKGIKQAIINTSEFTRKNKYLQEFTNAEIKDLELLDNNSVIKVFSNYLIENCKSELKRIEHEDINSMHLSIADLSEYDYLLVEQLFKFPIDCIDIFRECLNNYLGNSIKKINVRIIDLPKSENIKIGSQRKDNIDKLVCFNGLIRRKSDVKPKLVETHYICTNPSCEFSTTKLKIPQIKEKIQILKSCPKCKSGVENIGELLDDNMIMILEQDFKERKSDLETKQIHIKIDSDLTNESNYNKLKISSKVSVVGILKAIPKNTRSGSESVNYDYILEANSISFIEDEEDYSLSKSDINEFKEFGKREECFDIVINSFLPRIYGNKILKQALLLQHIGSNFSNQRNNSHILILGDPSTGKTEIINESLTYSLRSVYSSGTSSSKAGLTAIALKDELTGTWVLEPGVLPRANGGIAGLDELDKLNKDDADCLTEALEQQRITVNKANIHAELQTKTSFLAGANPKYSRFDDTVDITNQINFNPALLSRFDLIFILRDKPNELKDLELIGHILNDYNQDIEGQTQIDKTFIKKYISYCKNNFKPILSQEANELITKYYVNVRKNININNNINFTPRQVKGVIRFAAAYACFKQSNTIDSNHIKFAFRLFNEAFKRLGYNNIKLIEDSRSNISKVNTILKSFLKNQTQTIEELKERFPDLLESQLKVKLMNLIKDREIYEPRKNTYKLIK